MIRVLIVDDEPLIRIGIKVSVSDVGDSVKVVAEEYNGARALEYLKRNANKVDCILTDIKMPVMDGIELIKRVKKDYPKIKIIVLSSFNDIDYVRDAMKNGASDYLLKHEIDDKNLVRKLEAIFGERELKGGESFEEEQICAEDRVKEMLTGAIFVSDPPVAFPAVVFSLDIKGANKELQEDGGQLLKVAVMNILQEYLSGSCNAIITALNPQKYAGLLPLDDGKCYENCFQFCAMLLKKYLNVVSHWGISDEFKNPREISKAYIESCAALEPRFFVSDKKDDYSEYGYLRNCDCKYVFSEYIKRLQKDKEKGDKAAAEANLEKLLAELLRYRGAKRQDIINGFYGLIEELSGPRRGADSLFLGTDENIFALYSAAKKAIFMDENSRQFHSEISIKNKAVEYINERYDDIELNLPKLAEYMCLSPSYLSRVFKSSVGMGFVEYLTKVRIEKAVQYIMSDADLSLQEISILVGFENYNHFSKTFKKVMGIAPSKLK